MKNRKILFHDQSMYSKNMGENFHFQHALNFCQQIYSSNSIYTFIPKNLSTTLRASTAIANKYINNNKNEFIWTGYNNEFFKPSIKDLFNANFTFVILRNPFLRLYSFYCNFISLYLHKKKENEIIFNDLKKTLKKNLTEFSFCDFINFIDGLFVHANSHWSPQKYFLIYENYDLYIPFEKFNDYIDKIELIAKIKLHDQRNFLDYSSDKFEKISNIFYGDTSGIEILKLISSGKIPHFKCLYNDKLISLVSKIYHQDIELYKNVFNIDAKDIFS